MKAGRKDIMFITGLILVFSGLSAQEDLASSEEMLVEQQNINFQTFFFEALQQKAIENYDKAIYALEACHDIDKENVAVLFELSKNYFFLIKYTEAEFYAQKALGLEPENIHLLRHLKEIKTKQNDFNGAIGLQRRIIQQVPDEESELVILYIKAGEIDQAVELLKKLETQNKVPPGLQALKESLLQENPSSMMQEQSHVGDDDGQAKSGLLTGDQRSRNEMLLEAFESSQSYPDLKALLQRELKTKEFLELLSHSEQGLSLFPAQPYVYLMHGTALNHLRKHQEAIDTLIEGMDYLVDDKETEIGFLEQLSLGYKGLGENKKASEYSKQASELKKELN